MRSSVTLSPEVFLLRKGNSPCLSRRETSVPALSQHVCYAMLSHFSCVRPHRRQPTRLLHPWDSPGKNTGVGCHFLLQFMKVKSESEVAQSCPTLHDPMDCSPPGSFIHGIFQARVLEWGAIAFSGTNPAAKSLQSCPTLCDPIDGIPPGPREYQIARTHKKETT